jgi:hypothetical protein
MSGCVAYFGVPTIFKRCLDMVGARLCRAYGDRLLTNLFPGLTPWANFWRASGA